MCFQVYDTIKRGKCQGVSYRTIPEISKYLLHDTVLAMNRTPDKGMNIYLRGLVGTGIYITKRSFVATYLFTEPPKLNKIKYELNYMSIYC
jgi:hypothetical protein